MIKKIKVIFLQCVVTLLLLFFYLLYTGIKFNTNPEAIQVIKNFKSFIVSGKEVIHVRDVLSGVVSAEYDQICIFGGDSSNPGVASRRAKTHLAKLNGKAASIDEKIDYGLVMLVISKEDTKVIPFESPSINHGWNESYVLRFSTRRERVGCAPYSNAYFEKYVSKHPSSRDTYYLLLSDKS